LRPEKGVTPKTEEEKMKDAKLTWVLFLALVVLAVPTFARQAHPSPPHAPTLARQAHPSPPHAPTLARQAHPSPPHNPVA
jgi:hypothetical protein